MSEQSTDELTGVVKRADQLGTGDLVVEVPEYGQPPRPMRVLLAHPFKDANNSRMVALALDAFDGTEPLYVRTTAGTKYDVAPSGEGQSQPAAPPAEPGNPDRRCRYCRATSGLKMLHTNPLVLAPQEWQCWDDCRDSAR